MFWMKLQSSMLKLKTKKYNFLLLLQQWHLKAKQKAWQRWGFCAGKDFLEEAITMKGFKKQWLQASHSLTLKVPWISQSCIEIKIKLNFHYHTSSWCLKRFYEGL